MSAEVEKRMIEMELVLLSSEMAVRNIRLLLPRLHKMLAEFNEEEKSLKTLLAFVDVLGQAVCIAGSITCEEQNTQHCMGKLSALLAAIAEQGNLPLPMPETPAAQKN